VVEVDNFEVSAPLAAVKLKRALALFVVVTVVLPVTAVELEPPLTINEGTTSPETFSVASPTEETAPLTRVDEAFDEIVTVSMPAAATTIALMPGLVTELPVVDAVTAFARFTVTASLLPVESAKPNVKVPV